MKKFLYTALVHYVATLVIVLIIGVTIHLFLSFVFWQDIFTNKPLYIRWNIATWFVFGTYNILKEYINN